MLSILIDDKSSRNNDNYLFYLVAKKILGSKGIDIDRIGFKELFLSLKDYGIPPYETVGRIRRKLQCDFPELSGNEKVSIQRSLSEEAFADYSK